MHRWFLIFVVLLASCGGPPRTGVFLEGTFELEDDRQEGVVTEMRYLLRFPERWQPGETLPLVVYLHGSGDDDYDSRWLTGFGVPAAIRFGPVGDHQRFVLLAPQAAPGTSWEMAGQVDAVMRLVDEVIGDHGLDLDRVSVTGMSMGGYGTWHLVTRYPDRFQSAASVSGSGYGRTELPTDLDVCRIADVRFRAYHGSEDLVSALSLNRAVVEAWEVRCGAELDFRVVEGTGHFTTADEVYSDPGFYDWLLTD
ncbi:MAG: alpha/beta hydrolase-fold protein [Acidimicrobiia bacterium]